MLPEPLLEPKFHAEFEFELQISKFGTKSLLRDLISIGRDHLHFFNTFFGGQRRKFRAKVGILI